MLSRLDMGRVLSKLTGAGNDFYRNALFESKPDPSKVDITTSVKDPFESLYVKTYRERNHLQIITLVDLSSSLFCDEKYKLIVDFYSKLVDSVEYYGDLHRGYAISNTVTEINHFNDLISLTQDRKSAYGFDQSSMVNLKKFGIHKDAIVFLISDFCWNGSFLSNVLKGISENIVIPVLIENSNNVTDLPVWRFIKVRDVENTGKRLLFLTPGQKEALIQQQKEHMESIKKTIGRYGYRIMTLKESIDMKAINHYFNLL